MLNQEVERWKETRMELNRVKVEKGRDFSNNLRYKMRKEDGRIQWYLRPISVVLLPFFVLGPFGLPLLYKSPKFSKTLKIILTIIVVIYTSCFVFASLEIGRELYRRMGELQDTLK